MDGWGCYRPDVFVKVFVDQLKGIALEWAVAAKEEYTSVYDYTSWQPKVRVHEVNEPNNVVWWLCRWGSGVHEFEPLTDWKVLGDLIDKYELTFTTTSRDHPDQRFVAFCPGEVFGDGGRGYAADKKTAMLRAILLRGIAGDQRLHAVEVPYDLAVHAKCWLSEEQIEGAFNSSGDTVEIIRPQTQPTGFDDIAVDNEF